MRKHGQNNEQKNRITDFSLLQWTWCLPIVAGALWTRIRSASVAGILWANGQFDQCYNAVLPMSFKVLIWGLLTKENRKCLSVLLATASCRHLFVSRVDKIPWFCFGPVGSLTQLLLLIPLLSQIWSMDQQLCIKEEIVTNTESWGPF